MAETEQALQTLQVQLGYSFRQSSLLTQALTHRSFSSTHNERLEFLGDSVLNLAIAAWLYESASDLPEGDLSRMRSHWVKQDALASVAKELGIASGLRLGEGELRSGGKTRPSILADAVEAIIGAVYLDGGFEAARQVVLRLYQNRLQTGAERSVTKDHKTALQEWLQARKMPVPVYQVVKTSGAAHQQEFEVTCSVHANVAPTNGCGHSRRAAEQAAAGAMMQQLQSRSSPQQGND